MGIKLYEILIGTYPVIVSWSGRNVKGLGENGGNNEIYPHNLTTDRPRKWQASKRVTVSACILQAEKRNGRLGRAGAVLTEAGETGWNAAAWPVGADWESHGREGNRRAARHGVAP